MVKFHVILASNNFSHLTFKVSNTAKFSEFLHMSVSSKWSFLCWIELNGPGVRNLQRLLKCSSRAPHWQGYFPAIHVSNDFPLGNGNVISMHVHVCLFCFVFRCDFVSQRTRVKLQHRYCILCRRAFISWQSLEGLVRFCYNFRPANIINCICVRVGSG